MDWNKLKEERCPRCGQKLHPAGMLDSHRHCSGSHCLFKIEMSKFDSIVANVRRKETRDYDPDENLSALNNL